MDRKEAIEAGHKWYTPDTPCPKCHTTADRYVANGRCRGCHPPTQEHHPHEPNRGRALTVGNKLYIPQHICSKCNTLSPRYTATNKCMGCSNPKKAASILLMNDNPYLVVERRTAEWLGLVYYRNRHDCIHDHTAWLSMVTGECLECTPPNWMIPATTED